MFSKKIATQLAALLGSSLLLASCASVHPGREAQKHSGDAIQGLVISAEELADPNKDPFSLVAITLENKTGAWIRIDKIRVEIDEDAAKFISVASGPDIRDWAEAHRARANLEAQQKREMMTALAVTGAVASLAGGRNESDRDRSLSAAGAGAMAAAYSWAVTDAIETGRALAERPDMVPAAHLYNNFGVPGTMFLRKWILINKPLGKKVSVLPIRVRTVDGREAVFNLTL